MGDEKRIPPGLDDDVVFEPIVGGKDANWDEHEHPRDPIGRFTESIGGAIPSGGSSSGGSIIPGAPASVEQARSPEWRATHIADPSTAAKPTKVGDDIDLAVKLLSEGKPVELDQPREASTLLDKLAAMVDDAKKRGDKAPEIDLCKVSVPGTNLFCAESEGIPRIKMPQLKGVPEPGTRADRMPRDERGEVDISEEFLTELRVDLHVTVREETEKASNLKATQDQINGAKVAGMAKFLEGGGHFDPDPPLFISREGYIVDGHHRWASKVAVDLQDNHLGDVSLKVRRVDMDIITLLAKAQHYSDIMGIPQVSVDGASREHHEPQNVPSIPKRVLHPPAHHRIEETPKPPAEPAAPSVPKPLPSNAPKFIPVGQLPFKLPPHGARDPHPLSAEQLAFLRDHNWNEYLVYQTGGHVAGQDDGI